MRLKKMKPPKYELKEIIEYSTDNSTQSGFEFEKLRFLLSDGKKFFFMRPQLVERNASRLCCYSFENSSEEQSCKASVMLEFKANIQTEFDGSQRRIVPTTRKRVLMSTSSYTLLTHLVRTSNNVSLRYDES